jgi:hypothetical protein
MFVQLLKPHSKSCWVESACFKRRLGAKTRTQDSKTSQTHVSVNPYTITQLMHANTISQQRMLPTAPEYN